MPQLQASCHYLAGLTELLGKSLPRMQLLAMLFSIGREGLIPKETSVYRSHHYETCFTEQSLLRSTNANQFAGDASWQRQLASPDL